MTTRSAPIFYVIARKPSAPAKGGKTPAPTRVDVSSRVTSLEYTDTEKGADKLTLTIDNYSYATFDEPTFADGNILEVSWGYPEQMSPKRECVISKVTGGNQLKIDAVGKDYLLMLERKVRTFQFTTRADVVRQIAREAGFSNDQIFIEETSDVFKVITQPSITDYMLVAQLARKEGFVHWIDHLGFHWKKRDLLQTPLRKFIYFSDPGRGDIDGPINIENDLTAKPATIAAAGVDPKTKKPIDAKGDNDKTKRDGLAPILTITNTGKKGGYKTKGGQSDNPMGTGAKGPTSAASQKDAQKEADSAYKSVQMSAAKISFSAVGDPTMAAKKVITCSGFSKTLAGNYYVTEVKHSLGQGYRMTVKATRDGKSSATTAAGATLAGKTSTAAQNKQKAANGTAADDGKEKVLVPISKTGAAGTVVKFGPAGSKQP
jgi:phage protein D